jgi:phenolic acid decarboxylase
MFYIVLAKPEWNYLKGWTAYLELTTTQVFSIHYEILKHTVVGAWNKEDSLSLPELVQFFFSLTMKKFQGAHKSFSIQQNDEG